MLYLDHAATTPMAAEVAEAMRPWLAAGAVGNASSTHAAGRAARAAVEDARDQVADALGVPALDVIFTSGGTEADNQGIKGLAWAAEPGSRVITTAVEHHASLDPCTWLGEHGHETHVVWVDQHGVVDVDRLLDLAQPGTAVVSVMAANNEIGTIQPLEQIGPVLAERGVPLHVDAVQAFGRMPLDLDTWQPTALAISGHKLNGPTGVGALVLRRDVAVHPVLHGGGQERDVRSGTLNVAGIVGLGAACARTAATQEAETARLAALQADLVARLTALDGVSLNGHPTRRLPNNASIAVAGCDAESLMLALDREGLCCSTGSACQSGAATRSHVLDAIGADPGAAHIRLSLGCDTTPEVIDRAVAIITRAAAQVRGR